MVGGRIRVAYNHIVRILDFWDRSVFVLDRARLFEDEGKILEAEVLSQSRIFSPATRSAG